MDSFPKVSFGSSSSFRVQSERCFADEHVFGHQGQSDVLGDCDDRVNPVELSGHPEKNSNPHVHISTHLSIESREKGNLITISLDIHDGWLWLGLREVMVDEAGEVVVEGFVVVVVEL
jgi:hypothetical protein